MKREQIVQTDCGVSITGAAQNSAEHLAEPAALPDPALSRGCWPPEAPFQPQILHDSTGL